MKELIMNVSVGSDHRGLEQRRAIVEAIEASGNTAIDLGTFSTESFDYPDIAAEVGRHVSSGNSERGILVCGTGIGMSMAANKIDGVRAALCVDLKTAELSRQHNNANVLCLPGDGFNGQPLKDMVTTWLSTGFEGGRHERRVGKIMSLENECEADS